MFDTVVASTVTNLPDLSMFTHQQTIDEVTRYWRNPRPGVYEPRLTYWSTGRLRVEFSIPKMLGISSNPLSQTQVNKALYSVNAFMYGVGIELQPSKSHIRSWRCQRVDYAWNFPPSPDVPAYISQLQGLWLGQMSRHPHPDQQGVVWKSAQPNYRWVKFYNKSVEARSNGTPVLRFEVSNYHKALRYMCQSWFDCEPTVEEVLKPGRALYVMARMWEKLGVDHMHSTGDEVLLLRLRRLFGRGAASAYYALHCIQAYGMDSVKVHGLLNRNNYYHWYNLLSEQGLLSVSSVSLPPLHLPVLDVFKELKHQAGQNLGNRSSAVNMWSQKIPPKNWQEWSNLLQVSEKSPEISGLLPDLALSWERLNGSNVENAGNVGRLRKAVGFD